VARESFDGKGLFYAFSNAAVENLLTGAESFYGALDEIGIQFDPATIKASQ
jgi:hypothetical protein